MWRSRQQYALKCDGYPRKIHGVNLGDSLPGALLWGKQRQPNTRGASKKVDLQIDLIRGYVVEGNRGSDVKEISIHVECLCQVNSGGKLEKEG